MKNKSLGKNAILNVIKSAMAVIFPLITFPYVSNVLGVESLGKYNFAYSFSSYFLMIAALGISTYAVREGAVLREDRKRISEFSSEILTINMYSSVVSYLLLALSLYFIPKLQNYSTLILIFSVEIFFSTFGLEWIYIIYEEYFYITIRRIVFQFISVILLFVFVKEVDDAQNYVIITVIANAGANLLNILNIKKYCDLRVVAKPIKIARHVKPILVIFAAVIAIKIYTSSDSVMLGFFCGDREVGLYAVAVKVYNVLKPLLSAVLVVAIPRLAAYIGGGMKEAYENTLQNIFRALIVIIMPAVVGLFMLSKQTILILSNPTYLEANLSLKFLSIAIIFSIFSSFYNQCVLIPMKQEQKFLIATVISASVNIALNLILIPLFAQNGAAFSTVIAEFTSFLLCYIAARKSVKMTNVFRDFITVLLGCFGIVVTCIAVYKYELTNTMQVAVSIILSMSIYTIILLVTKNSVINYSTRYIREKIMKE